MQPYLETITGGIEERNRVDSSYRSLLPPSRAYRRPQLRLRLDPTLDVMRDVNGKFTWSELLTPLPAAMTLANNPDILDLPNILSGVTALPGA